MADDTHKIRFLADTTAARRAIEGLAADFDRLGTTVGKDDAALRRHDRALIRMSAKARVAADDLVRLRQSLSEVSKETTEQRSRIKVLETSLEGAKNKMREQRAEIKALTQSNISLGASNARLVQEQKKELQTLDALHVADARAFIDDQRAIVARKQNIDSIKAEGAAREQELASMRKHMQSKWGGGGDLLGMENTKRSIVDPALRYALYDVANSFRVFRDAGVAALGDVLTAGIDFERNFANVIRTSQVTNPEVFANTEAAARKLRDEFLDLQSSIPVTSEELTRIGTLAAQMGIAASEVAEFTEITAKFAAASGISADESATSLARLGQMMAGDVQGNYEKLASAILKTGVNAIATEQQIVRGSTQIASIGKVAGLSAVDVVALSSAMSSLGMSPELQRSVVTSSFTRILTAVRSSSAEAEKFGRILGMTGKEFQEAWDNDGYNTYRKLLAAIAQSDNAIGTLQELRLASQRLTPNLLKLGQSYKLLGETRADTQKGWEDESELQRQYQVIMDTTASKLQVLQQTWEAFLVVIGSEGVKALGDFAGWLSKTIAELRTFAETPVGQFVAGLVLGIMTLATGLAALLTAVTLAGAGMLGFQFVMSQMALATTSASGALAGQTAILRTFTMAAGAARVSVVALNTALKAVGPLLVASLSVAGLSAMNNEFVEISRSIKGLGSEYEDLLKTLSSGQGRLSDPISNTPMPTFNTGGLSDLSKDLQGWQVSFSRGLGALSGETWGVIRNFDEDLASLALENAPEASRQLELFREAWVASGQSADTFASAMPDTIGALSLTESGLNHTNAELEEFQEGMDAAASAEEAFALHTEAVANALGLTVNEYQSATDALKAYTGAVQNGMGMFFDFGSLLENAYGAEKGQGGGITRLQEDLDASLEASKVWADGIAELTYLGAGQLAAAFAAQGPASQQAITEALSIGPEALAKLEQSAADAAFFASEAFAQSFAQENAVLANVYSQMLQIDPSKAMDAVHEARAALRATGGVLDPQTIAALQGEYGFTIDVGLSPDPFFADQLNTATALAQAEITPLTVPVTTTVGQGDFTVTKEIEHWRVEMEGHSIVMPVDPNTDEGRDIIKFWRDNEYNTPLALQTKLNFDAANLALTEWANSKVAKIKVQVQGAPGWSATLPMSASGSLVRNNKLIRDNYPGFASGTILKGPGTGTSDSILARLSNGEAVTRAAAVRFYGPKFFEDVNKMRFPRFATGFTPQGRNPASVGAGTTINATVIQNYPTTQDPIKKLKEDAEAVISGIWT